MESKSLRAIAKELGVSHSYLSQVINGKRPASEKVLTTLLTSGLMKSRNSSYNERTWQRSSAVEQGTHKPLVAGSIPAAATKLFLIQRESMVVKSIALLPVPQPCIA